MIIRIETTTKKIVDNAIDRSATALLEFIAGDGEPLQIQYLRNGVPMTHPTGTTFTATLKTLNGFESTPLASTTTFTAPLQLDQYYEGTIALDGAPITEALAGNVPKLDAAFEVEWLLPGATLPVTTFAVPVTIHNDYTKPTDEIPQVAVPGFIQQAHNIIQLVSTGDPNFALNGIPTVGLSVPRSLLIPNLPSMLSTAHLGVLLRAELVAGVDATDESKGIIRPLDYNAVTNAKVWQIRSESDWIEVTAPFFSVNESYYGKTLVVDTTESSQVVIYFDRVSFRGSVDIVKRGGPSAAGIVMLAPTENGIPENDMNDAQGIAEDYAYEIDQPNVITRVVAKPPGIWEFLNNVVFSVGPGA